MEIGSNKGETSPPSMYGGKLEGGHAGDGVVSSDWSSRPDECYTHENAQKPSFSELRFYGKTLLRRVVARVRPL